MIGYFWLAVCTLCTPCLSAVSSRAPLSMIDADPSAGQGGLRLNDSKILYRRLPAPFRSLSRHLAPLYTPVTERTSVRPNEYLSHPPRFASCCFAVPPPISQMEDHYTAVVLKNSNRNLPRGRPTSPRKKGGRGKSPRKGSSKGSRRGGSKSRSKSPRKGRKKKVKKRSTRNKRGVKGKRRGGGGGDGERSTSTNKVYASAGAFMAEHFPAEGGQVMRGSAVREKIV